MSEGVRVSTPDTNAIRERVAKLPNGEAWNDAPWSVFGGATGDNGNGYVEILDCHNDVVCYAYEDEGIPEFIAHAREDIPALCDALDATRDALRQLVQWEDEYPPDPNGMDEPDVSLYLAAIERARSLFGDSA